MALVLEEALEQREDDERAGVADVDAAVDGRAAGVDAHAAGSRGSRGRRAPESVSCREIVRTRTRTLLASLNGAKPGFEPGSDWFIARRGLELPMSAASHLVDDAAFRSLPERYLGSAPGFDATFQIRLVDVGHIWKVRTTPQAARVRKGTTRRAPDVVITTDAETWLRLRAGELSGVEAPSASAG